MTPNNTDELFEYSVGNEIADIFFRPYTRKMWGIDPKQLEISIGARLPIRTNEDDRYFNDNFQALPKLPALTALARRRRCAVEKKHKK